MRQICCSYFGACEMVDIFEVQIIPAVIKHVNEFMCQDSLNDSLVLCYILANYHLIQDWIISSGDGAITHLTRNVATNINFASRRLQCSHHQLDQRRIHHALVNILLAFEFIDTLRSFLSNKHIRPASLLLISTSLRIQVVALQ